jgi:hypothetical protein
MSTKSKIKQNLLQSKTDPLSKVDFCFDTISSFSTLNKVV